MRIPLAQPSITDLERSYVKEALDNVAISGTAEHVARFEKALAQRLKMPHAIAVANGTVALEAVLRALNIGIGDEVIVPALTFVSPAAMVKAVGAEPVFADITPENWTISGYEIERVRTRRTKAVIAVDIFGHPANYDWLSESQLPVIEDAAEAHGALYKGKPCGSFGIAATFSFHANKVITTGEGGAVLTRDKALAERIRLLKNHAMRPERPYHHEDYGHNWRLSNLPAAIGLGQVERWNELVEGRKIVQRAYDLFLPEEVMRQPVSRWATPSCWMTVVAHPKRDQIVAGLRAKGIDARAIWTALVDLPIYADGVRHETSSYPHSRWVSRYAFLLPTWHAMPLEYVEEICDEIGKLI